jgi:hypothetical protein
MIARINIPIDVEIEMESDGSYIIKAKYYDEIYANDDGLENTIEEFKDIFIEYLDLLIELKNEKNE